jgi:Cu-Zn family superoxide dismutase
MKILAWHVHGSYLNALGRVEHEWYLPVKPGEPEGYRGRAGYDLPPWVRDVPADRVRDLDLDLVVYQTPKNLLDSVLPRSDREVGAVDDRGGVCEDAEPAPAPVAAERPLRCREKETGMHRVLGLLAALALLAVGPLAALAAQEATPTATVEATLAALLQDVDGVTVAVALLAERGDGEVSIGVTAVGLNPGPHGIHIHETGVCDPAGDRAFASAGGHYNPTEDEHGDHAGDLGNIDADEDGTAVLRATTDAFGLDELLDEDGTAIVIHAEEDENDPAGESYGARIACGVLAEPAATEPTPAANPEDTDGDGLSDDDEVDVHGTDPTSVDTDLDGVGDGDEVAAGTDPLDPASL